MGDSMTNVAEDKRFETQKGMEPNGKYTSYLSQFNVQLPNRTWPNNQILKAPEWCSVDLRDGNQALANPMSVEQKLRFYQMLLDIGFRQIEIGYPAASRTEHEFARTLIEEGRIPQGVKPQVLVAAREDLIRGTFDAIKGGPETIVHVYNSTSRLQRDVVYRMSKDETLQRAVEATKLVRRLADATGTPVQYQYSPESFTGTELEFARDICNAVIEAWEPTSDNKIIINLPSTVEMAMPNVYADQIEWMCRNLKRRESVIVSVHPHNDRGTGIAAAELGMLAGADRVEGTLFGNGERAGNVDLVILALNLYTQGINPGLDFRDIPGVREVYEQCTGCGVPERHSYGGDAASVAYSGTHQLAIRKGLEFRAETGSLEWNVPYLPIDHEDIGKVYTPIVVNSQSGKNGTAFVLDREYGIRAPKEMEGEVAKVVQSWCERSGNSISPEKIKELFEQEFVHREDWIQLRGFKPEGGDGLASGTRVSLDVVIDSDSLRATGTGNGPIDAAVDALGSMGHAVKVRSFTEHSLGSGSGASAIAYMQVAGTNGARWGVGIDTNTELAAIKALMSAVNRLQA